MKNRYLPTALGLYINYIVHGMGVIIISQNSKQLALNWDTDLVGVASVISMLGIGRLIAILASGWLSDKFGRKPFVLLGMAVYALYFVGLVYSPNIQIAMFLTVLAGIANSFLDSGTYPALMESFPTAAGTATVLIKAAVQIGQVIFPVILGLGASMGMWQLTFFVAAAMLAANGFLIFTVPFPDADAKEAQEAGQEEVTTVFKSQPKMWLEGIAFVIYGFISQATFYLISQFISRYGSEAAGMTENAASYLLSYYSTGSLICVGVTALIGIKVRPINLVLPYTFMSLLSIAAMYFFPNPDIVKFGAAAVGFFAAGGVMQLGLTVMGEMFPAGKGTITGIFYTFGSIASFVVPIWAAQIAETNIRGIMLLDAVFAAIGFAIAVLVFVRYYQTVDTKASK